MRLLLFSLLLLPALASSQDKTKLRGIGEFIINETVFDSVETFIKGERFALYNDQLMQYGGSFLKASKLPGRPIIMLEILRPEDAAYRFGIMPPGKLVAGYRHMYINHYDIGDVAIANVQLLFKNDTLIRFHSDYTTEIGDAFRMKYGEDEKHYLPTKVKCIYKLTGAIEELEEILGGGEWVNGDIAAHYGISKTFDDNCKPKHLTWFYLEDKKRVSEYEALVKTNEATIKQEQQKAKEEKLKKF